MHSQSLIVVFAAALGAFIPLSGAATITKISTADEVSYSHRMLHSIIARKQGLQDSGAASSTLESGILAQAITAVGSQYPDADNLSTYLEYLVKVLDNASSSGLTNSSYGAKRPLDRFSLATAVEIAQEEHQLHITATTEKAYTAISESLALQIRNPDGGLWYYVYPQWSYLDGMFSLLPFMASQLKPNYTDMALQISLLESHCLQTNSSLLVHGYDWSRTAIWANKDSGASPFVWGRSLSWFLAGLVQTWERLPCESAEDNDADRLCSMIRRLSHSISTALLKHADPQTGAWWQIIDMPNRSGNYLESSSTALFTFSILKALRIGLLPGCGLDYVGSARRAYKYMLSHFVTDTGNGTIGYDKTVAVCSLNSTASYDYYVSQPFVPNSLLGESAFILASLEIEQL